MTDPFDPAPGEQYDFRALCTELSVLVATEYEHLWELEHGESFTESPVSDLLTRVRYALAQHALAQHHETRGEIPYAHQDSLFPTSK